MMFLHRTGKPSDGFWSTEIFPSRTPPKFPKGRQKGERIMVIHSRLFIITQHTKDSGAIKKSIWCQLALDLLLLPVLQEILGLWRIGISHCTFSQILNEWACDPPPILLLPPKNCHWMTPHQYHPLMTSLPFPCSTEFLQIFVQLGKQTGKNVYVAGQRNSADYFMWKFLHPVQISPNLQ